MDNTISGQVADVVLAADRLADGSVQMLLTAFTALADKRDRYTPAERELFHSVGRLLASVRDVRQMDARADARMERRRSVEPDRNEAMREEFAHIASTI